MDFKDLVPDNWIGLLSALGIGSGSGILGNKIIDREQNKRIKALETTVDHHKERLKQVENDISVNTKFDKQFKEQYDKDQKSLQSSLTEIKTSLAETNKAIFNIVLKSKQ